MDDTPSPSPGPKPRVPAVEPDLLGSALFLFQEYLAGFGGEDDDPHEDDALDEDEDEDEAKEAEIDTKAVLDLFAENLGTSVPLTLALYMRVTALFRLLAASPNLTQLATEGEEFGGALTETALVAAARLDLYVSPVGSDGAADYDPREFREALAEG